MIGRIADSRLDDWLVAVGHADMFMMSVLNGQTVDVANLARDELEDVAAYMAVRLAHIATALHGAAAVDRLRVDLMRVVDDLRDLSTPAPDTMPDHW